jgi:hypothetical protein
MKSNLGADTVKHLKYLRYVVLHKWYVFVACCKLGIPLRGIVHDWSKFLPSEWMPYAEFFYGPYSWERGSESRPPQSVDDAFDMAWNHHQKRNKHHWQYWIRFGDDGTIRTFAMPDRYRKEMLADWRGAGAALGKPDTLGWYRENRRKMQMHPGTRAWIEAQLGY